MKPQADTYLHPGKSVRHQESTLVQCSELFDWCGGVVVPVDCGRSWPRKMIGTLLRPGGEFALPATLKRTTAMQVSRITHLPEGIAVLTATGRGMTNDHMIHAAQQAYGELLQAVNGAGLPARVTSYLSLLPDDPKGPDDADCRFIAGVVFGYSLATLSGECEQPAGLALSGTLAWQWIASGRYAVFTHIGPYTSLHRTWKSIYRDWLPRSGEQLRQKPPMELNLNRPETVSPEALRTEIWLPLRERRLAGRLGPGQSSRLVREQNVAYHHPYAGPANRTSVGFPSLVVRFNEVRSAFPKRE
jgi:DNA gyrase inhibitor GyrI